MRRPLPLHIRTVESLQKVKWSPTRMNYFNFLTPLWGKLSVTDSDWLSHNIDSDSKRDDNKISIDFLLTRNESKPELKQLKSLLDHVHDRYLFKLIRDLTNPFENIGRMTYQNRSAVKLLEIDYLLNGALVKNRSNADGFCFLDLCGGPGGYSNYVFSTMQRSCLGIGVTLRSESGGTSDWNLSRVLAETATANIKHTFIPFYGPDKSDGDITKPENLQSIVEFIKSTTASHGVDLIVADGGLSVDGDEDNQEIRHIQLILGEFLIGILSCKRNSDSYFLCKIFDHQLHLSRYITILTSQFFEKTIILKPEQSRPASSERYVLFRGRLKHDNDFTNSCLKWLLAMYLALGKVLVAEHVHQHLVTLAKIKQALSLISFDFPTASASWSWSWSYFVAAQVESESLQVEYLTALHETLALFDTFYPRELSTIQVRKNLVATFGTSDQSARDLCTDRINTYRAWLAPRV
jgi:23S rRNA U2552 (ribose-2'-O)-methylase RlmE/FtsJ